MYGSANDKYRHIYFLINKLTKEDLSLLYFYVFQYKFIDLVHFLALLLCPCHMTKPKRPERACSQANTTHTCKRGEGSKGAWSSHKFTNNNNFAFHESRNK